MSNYTNIQNIVESYMTEADDDSTLARIIYTDLDMEGRQKILTAIENANEGLKVFTDDAVREQVEEALSEKPLIILDGEDIISNFDLLQI